jgi:3-oxoacyl-[acyl-carrier-protein] synthase III
MDNLKLKGSQERSKINMREPREVQYWTKHLKVSTEQLQSAVDKVGNAAAAVRKQLTA